MAELMNATTAPAFPTFLGAAEVVAMVGLILKGF
jgi:hypothetical protein